MDYSTWFAFFSYTITTAITPGPNNILALTTTANYGIQQSRKILLGIFLGFFLTQAICGIFSSVVVAFLPNILPYMKYVGAAYILWLAYHVAVSKPMGEQDEASRSSFWTGFLLQFANIKTILWGITAFTSYILPHYSDPMKIGGFIFLLVLIGVIATSIWAIFGVTFSCFLKKYWRITNIVMALLLVYSAIHLALEK